MKKVGSEKLFIKTGPQNPRNGEGTFTRLPDGRILFGYTEYYGTSWDDHAIARICGVFSDDEGETWSDRVVLLEKDEKAENIMSPSLFVMKNGELGMVYLRKELTPDGEMLCMPLFRSSSDCGTTWSEAVWLTCQPGYYCSINDGVSVMEDGRIYVPYSAHGKAFPNAEGHLVTSDDNGQTWNLVQTFRSPYTDDAGLAEPGFYAFPGGTQWSWFRTAYGNQYQSISHDGGKTWGPVIPNFCFTSPDSPMRVKKIHGCPHAVFNPQGFNCLLEDTENWRSPKRTPLVLAIGGENGEHFGLDGTTARNGGLLGFRENCYLLEEDRSNSYCYPCLQETRDGLLVSYYHSNGGNVCLNSTKITKVYREELEG